MKKDPIKICDVIHHRIEYSTQIFHVVDRMPDFIYERDGIWLTGEDSGFFKFYRYEAPTGGFQAFAGRKITIPLKSGETIIADGQWWDAVKPDYEKLVVPISIGTPEGLNRCNVFCGGILVDPQILQQIKDMDPSNNYYKYDCRHPDFGKHKIQSRWE